MKVFSLRLSQNNIHKENCKFAGYPARVTNVKSILSTSEVSVEHGLGIGQDVGARRQLCLNFAVLLSVQALPLIDGEHGASFRAVDLVSDIERLEALVAALDGALAGANGH